MLLVRVLVLVKHALELCRIHAGQRTSRRLARAMSRVFNRADDKDVCLFSGDGGYLQAHAGYMLYSRFDSYPPYLIPLGQLEIYVLGTY